MSAEDSKLLGAYELDWTDPSKMEDDELLAFIEQQYRAGKQRRQVWEQRAHDQMVWAEGHQDKRWDPKRSDLVAFTYAVERYVPDELKRPITINAILGVVLQKLALMLGGQTELHPIPMTDDDDDVRGTRMQSKLLRYMWYTGSDSVRTKVIWAIWLTVTTGISWLNPWWNPSKGSVQSFGPGIGDDLPDSEREARVGAFRKHVANLVGKSPDDVQLKDGKLDLPAGSVDWKIHSGFNVTEPEFATRWQDCHWLLVTEWETMESLAATYGAEAVSRVNPDVTEEQYLQEYRYYYGGRQDDVNEQAADTKKELVQVHRLWRPVAPWSPVGALVVSANGQTILKKGPHPYVHGRLPLVPMTEFPSDRLRPTCTVRNLMSAQDARNSLRSQMRQAIYMSVMGKHLVDENCLIKGQDLDAESRWIKVKTGQIHNCHRPLETPRVPPDAWREEQQLRQDIADIANVHDSTTGRGESKSQSGRHAALLLQGDSRSTFVTRELMQNAIGEACSQSLWLWWQFAKGTRAHMIAGGDFEPEFFEFSADDLVGKLDGHVPGPQYFNVRCELGPAQQLEEGLAKVEAMIKSKTWDPANPADRQKIERAIGEAGFNPSDPAARQRSAAQRENQKLLKLDPVKFLDRNRKGKREVFAVVGNDHDIHIQEHERFTVTETYRDAIIAKPLLERVFEVHRSEHLFMAAREAHEPEVIDTMVKAKIEKEMKLVEQLLGGPDQDVSSPGTAEPSPGTVPPIRLPGGTTPQATPEAGGLPQGQEQLAGTGV